MWCIDYFINVIKLKTITKIFISAFFFLPKMWYILSLCLAKVVYNVQITKNINVCTKYKKNYTRI